MSVNDPDFKRADIVGLNIELLAAIHALHNAAAIARRMAHPSEERLLEAFDRLTGEIDSIKRDADQVIWEEQCKIARRLGLTEEEVC